MKIITQGLTDEAIENNDYRDAYAMIIDGVQKLCVRDGGEPEDNSLNRDLNFVYGIVDLMKLAYEAGKRGEELEVTKEEVEEIY